MFTDPPVPSVFRRQALSKARSVADLRRLAGRRLPRGIFDFIDGGAEDEVTMRRNRQAFEDLRLLPRTLVDVSRIDTAATLLGQPLSMPLLVGPTGAPGFIWPRGDLAIARAAQNAGIPFALSTSASVSIENLASRISGRRWFQSYIFKDRDFTDRLIERAERAGYEALVITVDFPVGGNRERDFRNDFSMPFKYTPRNLLDFACHPGWGMGILRNGTPKLENLAGFVAAQSAVKVASSVGRNYDASFCWDDLSRIRDRWSGKLVVKGIARPDDARRLVAIGSDAIVVSNHGGRQLDGAIASLDALPEIVSAVGDKLEVLLDGGIRRGSDIVKALALGAKAVLIGRATLYGTAVAGEPGAARAIEILQQEFVRTMQLCGITHVAGISADLLSRLPVTSPSLQERSA